MNEENLQSRFGFVSVLGETNAGKSTLVNRLVGAKVSIVTPRRQTTRNRILGLFTHNHSQIALIDTPGLFAPKRRLERGMVKVAEESASGVDAILLVIDASVKFDQDIIEKLQNMVAHQHAPPLYIALNKIDRMERPNLLKLASDLSETLPARDLFMISALNGDGVDHLQQTLADVVPKGVWHYDPDQLSDMPERLLAAEITRERLLLRLGDELPYHMGVITDDWQQRDDGSLWLHQTILVTNQRHRQIVLGAKGQQIKAIGQAARRHLTHLFERTVHLKLFVKVETEWQNNREYYALWNLDFKA